MVSGQFEFSEPVTGSANFPDLGITCLGNIAVFVRVCMKGMLTLEMGARDVLAATRGPKLEDINGFGLSTRREYTKASVVMLSTYKPNSSMRQFMKYLSHAHDVDSILLKCFPLKSVAVTAEICKCRGCQGICECIVFWTVEEITMMLARRIPGTLKGLSDSLLLLPSLKCLRNGCHGCNQGLLHVEGGRLTEGDPRVEFPAAVCRTLDYTSRVSIVEERICICIPVNPPSDDHWTKMLMRSFTSKDKEDRGAIVMASDALRKYLDESREERVETVEYNTISFIMPRFVEVFVNLLLTGWFRVDGFSSALVARKAVRNYVVDSKGNGFAANAFLSKALVNCNVDNTNVCQMLTFRGDLVSLRTLSFIVGCGNLICSIGWIVLIAVEGGPDKWYDVHSRPPSKPAVALIMAGMVYNLIFTCVDLHLSRFDRVAKSLTRRKPAPSIAWVAMIVLEMVCILYCSTVVGTVGVKGFGTWLYSVVQGIVWVKWGIASYLLGEYLEERDIPRRGLHGIVECGVVEGLHGTVRMRHGIVMYFNAFLLNALLAGVRGRWDYSWKGFTM
jgi:hypothetical protein